MAGVVRIEFPGEHRRRLGDDVAPERLSPTLLLRAFATYTVSEFILASGSLLY